MSGGSRRLNVGARDAKLASAPRRKSATNAGTERGLCDSRNNVGWKNMAARQKRRGGRAIERTGGDDDKDEGEHV